MRGLRDDEREQRIATGGLDHLWMESRGEQVGRHALEQLSQQRLHRSRRVPVLGRTARELERRLERPPADGRVVMGESEAQ